MCGFLFKMDTENWTWVLMIAHQVPYRWSHLSSPLESWGWLIIAWSLGIPYIWNALFLISPSDCNPELSPQRWSNSKEKLESWELEPMGDRHGGDDLRNLWDLRAWLASTICIQKFGSAITTHIHHWHMRPPWPLPQVIHTWKELSIPSLLRLLFTRKHFQIREALISKKIPWL